MNPSPHKLEQVSAVNPVPPEHVQPGIDPEQSLKHPSPSAYELSSQSSAQALYPSPQVLRKQLDPRVGHT